MKTILWNDGWIVKRVAQEHGPVQPAKAVTLPHDALLETKRSPTAWNGSKKGFFESGSWEYYKSFIVPENWKGKEISLFFEGVYAQAMVYVNGSFAGQHPYGYGEFTLDITSFLTPGADNIVKVLACADDDSRWYSGAGIYRDVHLQIAEPLHCTDVQIKTLSTDTDCALLEVAVTGVNHLPVQAGTEMKIEIFAAEQKAAEIAVPATWTVGENRLNYRLEVKNPKLWSPDAPILYSYKVTVLQNGAELDCSEGRFGIRTMALDAANGLRINGQTVKLRGACIHHDNGVIGARTFFDAEYRRIRKLKEAGFNAIRSAHHPASRALLDACDELGILVMEELTDMWVTPKSSCDYALDFTRWWKDDATAMVRKDFNHPSVIFYSIGNEIPDLAFPSGIALGREISDFIHSLDNTRFTTAGINGSLLLMNQGMAKAVPQPDAEQTESGDINEVMANLEDVLRQLAVSPMMDAALAEPCSIVDVPGYNYLVDRYESEAEKGNLVIGSETYPKDIVRIWPLVEKYNCILGDFTWTGWDYLGEVGVGRLDYGDAPKGMGFYGEYPWLTAHCGDFDITGQRLPISY